MFQTVKYLILVGCVCVQISVGQTTFFKIDNPLSPGILDSNSGSSASSLLQDSSSSAPLSRGNNVQISNDPSTSYFQLPSSSLGFSLNYPISPPTNPSPVESFVAALKSEVNGSKIFQGVFDLSEVSPETYSQVLYDYVYACGVDVGHSNPHELARVVATPLNGGIDTYTLPILLDIYANSVAKYLCDKGALNSSNASSLARKYVKTVEESAERNWIKEIPETKIIVLNDSFTSYQKSIGHFKLDTIDDHAIYFANEVKRVTNKS